MKSIQQNYAPPEGFETKEQRAAKVAFEAKKEAEKRARAEFENYKKEAEEKENRRKKQLVKRYLDSLNPTEQKELEREALSGASDIAREVISKENEAGEILKQYHIEVYVLDMLQQKEANR